MNTQLDPETLHGTHYTIDAFDAEVEKRVQHWRANEEVDGKTFSQKEIDNLYFNYRRDVYIEWTGANTDQIIQWEHVNSMKHTGMATAGFAKEETGDPLLAPIHGISLNDYAAISAKLASGISEDTILKALGIEKPVLDEVNTLWAKRMQEDGTFTVVTLFGQYFGDANAHPVLGSLQPTPSSGTNENLEKLRADRYFYEELCGARQAAYEYGIDGAQWILDNYGITLGDFQSVAMKWMEAQNKDWNSADIMHYINYQQEKQKEYAARFAKEQGGNVADDVAF